MACNEDMGECLVCTEIGTTEVTDETCERTCATREQDIVQLNFECLVPVADENCTCAENFVRENGECIHKDTCTNCIDEFGEVYEEGSSYSEDCKVYQCVNGEVLINDHVCITMCPVGKVYDASVPNMFDPCCGSCVIASEPGTSCALVTVNKVLETTDENGIVCHSVNPVDHSYCHGGCDNSGGDFIGEFAINGVVVTPSSSTCECCTGTGAFEEHDFQCDNARRTFQVKQMASCGCNQCGADGFETAEEQQEDTDAALAEALSASGGGIVGAAPAPIQTPSFGGLFG